MRTARALLVTFVHFMAISTLTCCTQSYHSGVNYPNTKFAQKAGKKRLKATIHFQNGTNGNVHGKTVSPH